MRIEGLGFQYQRVCRGERRIWVGTQPLILKPSQPILCSRSNSVGVDEKKVQTNEKGIYESANVSFSLLHRL